MESGRTYGLQNEYIHRIKNVFHSNPKIKKAILFGSRAKGNFARGSDIDLALMGKNISMRDIIKLHLELNKIWRGYQIDLVIFDKITEPALISHINRVGKELYSSGK